jgi:hypothetical protein
LLIPATAFAVTDPGGGSACFSAGLRMELPRAWLLLDQWLQEGEVSVNEEGAPEIRSLLA